MTMILLATVGILTGLAIKASADKKLARVPVKVRK